MVFWISWKQIEWCGYVQPGNILSATSKYHAHHELWKLSNSNCSYSNLKDILSHELLVDKTFRFLTSKFKLARSDNSSTFRFYKLSNILQYLSVIEIAILVNSNEISGNESVHIKAKSVSTCLFPTFIPLGFLIGILFCWIPFSDFGENKLYLQEFRVHLENAIKIKQKLSNKTDNSIDSKFICMVLNEGGTGCQLRPPDDSIDNTKTVEESVPYQLTFMSTEATFFISFIVLPVLAMMIFILFVV